MSHSTFFYAYVFAMYLVVVTGFLNIYINRAIWSYVALLIWLVLMSVSIVELDLDTYNHVGFGSIISLIACSIIAAYCVRKIAFIYKVKQLSLKRRYDYK